MVRQFGIAIVSFMVLDGLWLGLLMNGFYKRQLAPLARMSGGNLTPIWPAAAVVYVCLALGMTLLVLARARSPLDALALGAVLGLVIYGVYDFTNYATLRDWPLTLVMVDVAWGGVLCGATAWITATLTRTA
ncbi:MAG: DUF2177 family protein [Vicinamibacterales bacterium]